MSAAASKHMKQRAGGQPRCGEQPWSEATDRDGLLKPTSRRMDPRSCLRSFPVLDSRSGMQNYSPSDAAHSLVAQW
jgi:hypothetical protein